ncbi:MAG: GerMN domain-containing protein [Clostridiales bacterium]|nr:GerMN domain-containing protein [Clostridiales bacterium]
MPNENFDSLPQIETNADKSSSDNENNTEATNTDNKSDSNSLDSPYNIKDYYPMKANTQYIYEGTGNEFASYSLWTDYIKDNKVQLRMENGGTVTSKVIENSNNELKLVFEKEETYYREDFTNKTPNKEEILLKEPLVKGTQWTLPNDEIRTISNVNIEITTPSGSYKALEVTTKGKDSERIDYYVLNVGLVKSVFKSNGTEVVSSLKEIRNNEALKNEITFYYPDSKNDKLSSIKKTLTFKTNDITKMAIEKEFKKVTNDEQLKLLGPNVKINSLYLNKDGMVYVDFTKNFVSEMNVGASFELMILQAITNTLGQYYGVNKVYITLDGKPYSSGHISMKKGEAFTVDKSQIIE